MIHPNPHAGANFRHLKIGLLGGSFNPAHDGHLEMSRYALKRLRLDQIWWLVSPQNPLKSAAGMLPLAQRLLLAETTAANDPKIIVTGLETTLGTRYTIDTVAALRKHFPKTRFVWLMGSDNLQQLPRWRQWTKLFNTIPIAVFRRPGYPLGLGQGKATIFFRNAFVPVAGATQLSKRTAPAWTLLDNRHNAMSATALRTQRKDT